MVVFVPPQIFHDVAYKAKDRNDLVAGIDEFLDQVTVLPPGEWDPSIRIEPPKNVPSQVNTQLKGEKKKFLVHMRNIGVSMRKFLMLKSYLVRPFTAFQLVFVCGNDRTGVNCSTR